MNNGSKPVGGPTPAPVLGLHHFAYRCRDAEETRHFYEDILGLPLDCLARDKDGGAVLVYDNVKADRLGRRLPISAATAEVITSQQQRARQRFPGWHRRSSPHN